MEGSRVEVIITEEGFEPTRGSKLAAAYDLRAAIPERGSYTLQPGETSQFSSNVRIDQRKFQMPEPFSVAALVIPRSGLGSQGLVLSNLVGLIDADYQGEIKMNLWNRNSRMKIQVTDRMKVAQLLFVVTVQPDLLMVGSFDTETERGEGGHGSTGTH